MFGRKAKRLVTAAEAAQEALGEHQDRVLTRQFLTDAQARISLDAGESRLMALMRDEQATSVAGVSSDVREALREVDRKSLRAWMR